jgi:hypothetical protein
VLASVKVLVEKENRESLDHGRGEARSFVLLPGDDLRANLRGETVQGTLGASDFRGESSELQDEPNGADAEARVNNAHEHENEQQMLDPTSPFGRTKHLCNGWRKDRTDRGWRAGIEQFER